MPTHGGIPPLPPPRLWNPCRVQEDQPSTTSALLERAHDGVLMFGLTPPRASVSAERAEEIARVTLDRLTAVELDALVLYDVDAEAERSSRPRPFPFTPMMDPATYLDRYLTQWDGPAIVYRAVGKYTPTELSQWLQEADATRVLTVLAGATSRDQPVKTRLADAYQLHAQLGRPVTLGGVLIPERHASTGAEHQRMRAKQDTGCEFFISQVSYDLDHLRNVLSDYAYACRDAGVSPRPVVVTLAPCGSVTTLDFMLWLGIEVPRWLQTAIARSDDPLAESYEQCLGNASAIAAFCRRLGLPFGINVESLTNRKVEIEAAIELAREIRRTLL